MFLQTDILQGFIHSIGLRPAFDTTSKAAVNMYKPKVLFLLGREPREESLVVG